MANIFVQKNQGKVVKAFVLGAGSALEQKMIEEGKIVLHENGEYEIFSQEANSGAGEVAVAGKYCKIDNKGRPYPNDPEYFIPNHRHIEGDEYEQIPQPLAAWEATEEKDEVVQYLIDTGKLVISEDDESKYFGAMLWGAWLTAAKDAVVIFYDVKRDEEGNITFVDFNFVAREEFNLTYHYCQSSN